MESSREMTATLVRLPTSRAIALISTTCCAISGTSSLKSAATNIGSARDRISRGPLGVSSSRLSTARIGVTLVEVLAVILFAVRNDGFGFAEPVEHEHELAALDLLNFAGEQLADLAAELIADLVALAFAHPLDDPLLGGLHREATELLEGDFLFEHVAGLELGIEIARVIDADLPARILDGVDDLAEPHHADAAPKLVDRHLELDVGTEFPGQGGVNAILQQGQELPAIELLRVGELPECRQHFG